MEGTQEFLTDEIVGEEARKLFKDAQEYVATTHNRK